LCRLAIASRLASLAWRLAGAVEDAAAVDDILAEAFVVEGDVV